MNTLKTVENIITTSGSIMSAKDGLVEQFGKGNVDYVFADMPIPFHVNIVHGSKKIVIVGKEHAEDPEIVAGELAIGYLN